jgi:hypothetical protein
MLLAARRSSSAPEFRRRFGGAGRALADELARRLLDLEHGVAFEGAAQLVGEQGSIEPTEIGLGVVADRRDDRVDDGADGAEVARCRPCCCTGECELRVGTAPAAPLPTLRR